ncbi:glucosamine 6-phosphate N-acetyltransferase [Chlorella sorokiniana]|jgi:glucosamine-phosphate N-acetyltransferase|uniref:Glucosamine 6-phosphate N-acetyltransferase n=1 Tax=Chlorella sorokiniana TaxID=3076 RepID=A0A2P6TBZ5_CHLSO|nr:glucosamine 6-phosphate N-acetyltransferase [Chlorella sorokiniana]|eukprot:PRW18407.1 glucosamine 6-phosphate N-acetyltransferase [Chlorella sorokiniana]
MTAAADGKPAGQANILVRDLEASDYNKGYLQLLSQLTKVGDYDEATFKARFDEMSKRSDTYKVVVIEDLDKRQIIATATLVVELKFIRGCAKCGHVEDVVVDSTYRGLRLGLRVIEALMAAAQELGCYKVILDCSEENVPFYEKCGLTRKEVQMVKYL